jgi:D-xylonolactonase
MIHAKPEMVVDEKSVIGERPLRYPMEKRIYWLDIECGRIYRYDPDKKSHERVYQGIEVGGFTIGKEIRI